MQIVENLSGSEVDEIAKVDPNPTNKMFQPDTVEDTQKNISDAQLMHAKVLRHPWIQVTPHYFNTL